MAEARKPTHRVVGVTTRNGRSYWNDLGAAWQRDDGTGLDVQLFGLPLTGRLVIRPNDEAGTPEVGNAG
jgi:hypothetical protein